MNNTSMDTKDSVSKQVTKFKEFCSKHQTEIIFGLISVCSITYALVCKNKNINLQDAYDTLAKEHTSIQKDNQFLRKNNALLKSMCHEKDQNLKRVSSEALRLGGSYGGQQMNRLKQEAMA